MSCFRRTVLVHTFIYHSVPLSSSSGIHISRLSSSKASPELSCSSSSKERTSADKSTLQELSSLDPNNALTAKLEQLTEDALLSNPNSSTAKSLLTFQLPPELKQSLESRIANTSFNPQSSKHDLPSYTSKHTRDLANSTPWTGTEATQDTVLRMLVDKHKPLPPSLDTQGKKRSSSSSIGARLSLAKEKSLDYTLSKSTDLSSPSLSPTEQSELTALFKERFQPASRPIASVNILAHIADQKILEARSSGLFDNLPRGKSDSVTTSSSPSSSYQDTTTKLLNRLLKDQDLLPPWIEKQQELISLRDSFRKQMRCEWKRCFMRNIVSKEKGNIEGQIALAEGYAKAEKEYKSSKYTSTSTSNSTPSFPPSSKPTTTIFRSQNFLTRNLPYFTLQLDSLNSLTRSYNLIAPELAKKPYYSLERELDVCYFDVAALVVEELRNVKDKGKDCADAGLWDNQREGKEEECDEDGQGTKYGNKISFNVGGIRDSPQPKYGLREFWRDLFNGRVFGGG